MRRPLALFMLVILLELFSAACGNSGTTPTVTPDVTSNNPTATEIEPTATSTEVAVENFSPTNPDTLPTDYMGKNLQEIYRDSTHASEEDQRILQEFIDEATYREFEEGGIMGKVQEMIDLGHIDPRQARIWGISYWLRKTVKSHTLIGSCRTVEG